MARIYYDKDADLSAVAGKTVAIIGYGNQGRAQALNMRDSGVADIVVGSIRDESWTVANEDGFPVYPIAEASGKADIVFLLLPDEVAPEIYRSEIEPQLHPGAVVNFASGYNVTFGHIVPRADLDVIMVAPRMIGSGVRETYVSGHGFPCYVVVRQDASGQAMDIALGLCKAIGATKCGAIESSFEEETYLDLLSEQGTWPMIMTVMNQAFEMLIEKGHSPEAILYELYMSREPAFMMEKMADVGLFKQLPLHSRTSQYGQMSRFGQVDPAPIRKWLEDQYETIRSGRFAKEWDGVMKDDLKEFYALREKAFSLPISKAEDEVKKTLGGQND
ncbi:MAG: ketol-acid reductoisomerase [Clostridia bacterium]|nr:ketol-acid reductoisomerase [Clostridia bacterium]